MYENPILYLLWQDLEVCVVLTIVAAVIMAVVAVPVTFMANNPDEFRALPKRLLGNWFVGVVVTVGLWLLLLAAEATLMQLLPGFADSLIMPGALASISGLFIGIYVMWRIANTPARKQPRQFSLKTLLIAQLVILMLCGLWVALRREDIARLQEERVRIRVDLPR